MKYVCCRDEPWVTWGAAIGLSLGIAFGDLAIGLVFGTALGAVVDAERARRKAEDAPAPSSEA